MTTRLHTRALLMCGAATFLCHAAAAQEVIQLDAISVDSKRAVQTGEATSETVVDAEEPGKLSKTCRRHVCGVLYVCRGSRPDIPTRGSSGGIRP